MLRAAHWKCRTQKIAKNSISGHHHTNLSGYIFATKARIDSQKKLLKQQYLFQMSSQYGELWPTSTVLLQWASAKLCGVEQRAPPIFGRTAITLGIEFTEFLTYRYVCHIFVT